MLEDLTTGREIGAATDRLLRKADALYRFPTPVEDLVAGAGLTEPTESILSEAHLRLAPPHLLQILRKVTGKIQGLLDRTTREVHVRPDLEHDAHRRFLRLHEVSHGIFEWQTELAYADSKATLSPTAKLLFEREANQGGSELLFQGDVFRTIAAEYDIGFGAIIELHGKFGASLRATLRRFAETHRDAVAAVVFDRQPISTNPLAFRRNEAVGSEQWRNRFGKPAFWPLEMAAAGYDFIPVVAASGGRSSWAGQSQLRTGPQESVKMRVEVLNNSYHLLVLMWVPARRVRVIRRRRLLINSANRVVT